MNWDGSSNKQGSFSHSLGKYSLSAALPRGSMTVDSVSIQPSKRQLHITEVENCGTWICSCLSIIQNVHLHSRAWPPDNSVTTSHMHPTGVRYSRAQPQRVLSVALSLCAWDRRCERLGHMCPWTLLLLSLMLPLRWIFVPAALFHVLEVVPAVSIF